MDKNYFISINGNEFRIKRSLRAEGIDKLAKCYLVDLKTDFIKIKL